MKPCEWRYAEEYLNLLCTWWIYINVKSFYKEDFFSVWLNFFRHNFFNWIGRALWLGSYFMWNDFISLVHMYMLLGFFFVFCYREWMIEIIIILMLQFWGNATITYSRVLLLNGNITPIWSMLIKMLYERWCVVFVVVAEIVYCSSAHVE